MRKVLSLAVVALLLAVVAVWAPMETAVQAQSKAPGRKLAFLVGVKEYDHAQLKDLEYPERDVEEFSDVLKTAGFTVVLLTTASGGKDAARMPTIENINAQLAALLKKSTKRDLVLVGLAGHGIQPLGSDAAYFCPMDANPTIKVGIGDRASTVAQPDTLLSIDGLLQTLDDSGVGQKLLLMDACRNDPGVRGRRGVDKVRVSALPAETGVLLSCSSGQFAFEHKSWDGGHGAFFHQVIEGFKGQATDPDEGGVTWDSLVKHVRKRVPVMVDEQYGTSGGEQQPHKFENAARQFPVLSRSIEAPSLTVGTKVGQEWSGNGLKMKFCWCPPGTFTMGSPKDEPDREVDFGMIQIRENQVQVTLTKGFWLGKYEVTQGEWQRVMGTTVAEQRGKADIQYSVQESEPLVGQGATFPMYYVSHEEAVEFCEKLSGQERAAGRLTAGWAYRLPTEAQWEYGCRAGTTTATAYGNSLSSTQANFSGDAPYSGGARGVNKDATVNVGSYAPNAWGFHDMHGNVDEWCHDWYTSNLPGGIDPTVAIRDSLRVCRGGHWRVPGLSCRSAARDAALPECRVNHLGFRVAAVQLSQ